MRIFRNTAPTGFRNDQWGYTFFAHESNVTFTNDLWSECGADNPGLCVGALSGERIGVPGSDASTVVSSVFATLISHSDFLDVILI